MRFTDVAYDLGLIKFSFGVRRVGEKTRMLALMLQLAEVHYFVRRVGYFTFYFVLFVLSQLRLYQITV